MHAENEIGCAKKYPSEFANCIVNMTFVNS